jgi:hypothetical protein
MPGFFVGWICWFALVLGKCWHGGLLDLLLGWSGDLG